MSEWFSVPDETPEAIEALVAGRSGGPFEILGPHPARLNGKPVVAVRAFLPQAESAAVRRGKKLFPMQRLHPGGLFEAIVPGVVESPTPAVASADVLPIRYQLEITRADGTTQVLEDPYRFPPVLTDFDLHLFREGNHFQLYLKLGAHVMRHTGTRGVSFAVWAPNAERVSVIGDFNRWDERCHPMRERGGTGIWELFIPGLQAGELYKYHVLTHQAGESTVKADPYGFAMQKRPDTASVVWAARPFRWRDEKWMEARPARQGPDAPLNIYEVHLGSWRRVTAEGNRWLTYRELADQLVAYAKDMGYTHLELLPVSEHPFDGSWGYQTVGYFAPTSRFGTPDDFRYFVNAAHRAGLGVLLDWVPAHFPKDAHGLGFFDGTHLYEHADPRKGQHREWDTFVYNFGRHEVCAFLLSNAIYWLDEFHIDGLRVDAVASMLYLDYSRPPGGWVPNKYGGRENLEAVAFLQRFNELVHQYFPGALTCAEESTAWPKVTRPVSDGGLGFDYKWNMGWMHDILDYLTQEFAARPKHHDKLTFSLMYAYSEKFMLPLSHDEVVHGKRSLVYKMPGDAWRKFANLRALFGYMTGHPGKKLVFMGAEIGQLREWHHDRQLDWDLLEDPLHAGLQRWVRDLNGLYASEPALYQVDFSPEGFEWIDFKDAAHSIVSFIRRARTPQATIIVIANFQPLPQHGYRVGVPSPGSYRVLLNSDAETYGGSGVDPGSAIPSTPGLWQGRPHSIQITLPPLAVVFLAPVPDA